MKKPYCSLLFGCFLLLAAPSFRQFHDSALAQRSKSPSPSRSNPQPIRAVDFKNFSYDGHSHPNGETSLTLHDGSDGRKVPDDLYAASLESVKYLDMNSDGVEEAIVTIGTESGGSAGFFRDYFVYRYEDGSVRQIFHEWRETPKPIKVVGRLLTIVAPFWTENDAHCCASKLETSVYGWRGNGIVRISRRLTRFPDRY